MHLIELKKWRYYLIIISILDSIKISSKEETKEEIITNNEDVEEKK